MSTKAKKAIVSPIITIPSTVNTAMGGISSLLPVKQVPTAIPVALSPLEVIIGDNNFPAVPLAYSDVADTGIRDAKAMAFAVTIKYVGELYSEPLGFASSIGKGRNLIKKAGEARAFIVGQVYPNLASGAHAAAIASGSNLACVACVVPQGTSPLVKELLVADFKAKSAAGTMGEKYLIESQEAQERRVKSAIKAKIAAKLKAELKAEEALRQAAIAEYSISGNYQS